MIHEELNHPKAWKYAQPEIERRFLLANKPTKLESYPYKLIEDVYVHQTHLRLRRIQQNQRIQYKLTKKLPIYTEAVPTQWISTIYLSQTEFELFRKLPGDFLRKKRYYIPLNSQYEMAVDEIMIEQEMLWIAEVEFSPDESREVMLPFEGAREITLEQEYLGSELAKRYVGNE